jgi:hypothetical protein
VHVENSTPAWEHTHTLTYTHTLTHTKRWLVIAQINAPLDMVACVMESMGGGHAYISALHLPETDQHIFDILID